MLAPTEPKIYHSKDFSDLARLDKLDWDAIRALDWRGGLQDIKPDWYY